MKVDPKTIGVLAILGAALCWAIEPIFLRYSLQQSDFLQTSTLRAIIISLITLAYVFSFRKGSFKVKKKELSALIYVALAATVVGDLLYFYALSKIPIVNAILIGHLQTVFIIILGFFMLKEKLTKWDYLGVIFMILAGIFVSTKTMENFALFKLGAIEDILVVIATLAWATTVIVTKKYLEKVEGSVIAFYRFGISALLLSLYVLCFSAFRINRYQILIGLVVGIGVIFYYIAMKNIKAVQISALEVSAVFFATILGFIFFKETLTWLQIAGIVFLLLGVFCLAKKEAQLPQSL